MKKEPVHSDQARAASGAAKEKPADTKATQFDGNPNPESAPSGVFKPKDDTPFTLEKKEGPKP